MERAVSAELDNTATIITNTGVFDTVDKLYKAPASGATPTEGEAPEGGAPPAPDMGGDFGGGGAPPAPEGGAETAAPTVPESTKKERFKLLTEHNEDGFDEDDFLEFRKVNGTLGIIEEELSRLLKD
jgi:hypothetical protein